MIFVSVGTEKFQFNRLLKSIDNGIERGDIRDTVFAQTGSCEYCPINYQYDKYICYEDMVKNMKLADIIVIHAGVGSIVLSLELGRIPILFPRRRKHKEHLDDHQLELSKQMQTVNRVVLAYDETELISAITNYHSMAAKIDSNNASYQGESRLDQYLIRTFG